MEVYMSGLRWVAEPQFGDFRVGEGEGGVFFRDLGYKDEVWVKIDPQDPKKSVFSLSGVTLTPQEFIRGEGLTKRHVYHYTNRGNSPRLRVGLTIHDSVFSSLPHKFETNPTASFEEAFVMVIPEGGKGLVEAHGLDTWGVEVDTAYPVVGWDTLQVPMGWHRVVALPGLDNVVTPLAYVWAYLEKYPEWDKTNDAS